jgi:hypothetical protein
MELLKNLLVSSKNENKILCIYMYGEETDFWCGVIADVGDDYFVMNHYNKYGEKDGLHIERIADIERIDFENDYCAMMSFLIENNKKIQELQLKHLDIISDEKTVYRILEEQLNDDNRIVRIGLTSGNYFVGFVTWIDDESIILQLVDNDGVSTGKSLFALEMIKTIRINDTDAVRRMLLSRWRNKKV